MKILYKRILSALCCAMLIFSMTACSGTEQAAKATPTPAPETDISEVTPTPAPETENPEATPTPAPEGQESEEEAHQSVLPAPENGSEAFRTAFEGNPIDIQYAEDMEFAASVNGIVSACTAAAESWQAQIDSVYTQILERGDSSTVETVKAEQAKWMESQSDELQAIRDSISEDDPLAAVTVAQGIMLYYRTRAIDLCAVLYEIDGQLVFG